MTTVLTFLIPICAKYPWLLMINRFFVGLFEATSYPTIHAILTSWCPFKERSTHVGFIWCGASLGTAFGMPFAGVLCDKWGWRSVYYVYGFLGIVWAIFWFLLIKSDPAKDKYVSVEELNYIQNETKDDMSNSLLNNDHENLPTSDIMVITATEESSLLDETKIKAEIANKPNSSINAQSTINNNNNNKPIPWLGFLTNPSALVSVISHFTCNWCFYQLVTYMPTYMKEVLNVDVAKAAYVSMYPYLLIAFVNVFGAILTDYILAKNVISKIYLRKSLFVFGVISAGLFLMLSSFSTSKIPCVLFMTLSVGLSGFATLGYSPNILEISPRFGGILLGIANTLGALPGILAPIIVGVITTKYPGEKGWHFSFLIPTCLYVFSAIVFLLFAKVTPQPDLN